MWAPPPSAALATTPVERQSGVTRPALILEALEPVALPALAVAAAVALPAAEGR